jgi:hypothetical protein
VKRWLLIALAGAVCMGCPKPPTPPPVYPPDADAGPAPVPLPPADCDAACTNEKNLGCTGATACLGLCPRLLRNHPDYVVCVTTASSCGVIAVCDKALAGSGRPVGPGGGRTGP